MILNGIGGLKLAVNVFREVKATQSTAVVLKP